MAITIASAICDTWRRDVLMGLHVFKASAGNTFKMLLLAATATATGTYNATLTGVGTPGSGSPTLSNVGTDDNTGTNYTAAGFIMTPNADPALDTTNHVAYIDWTTDPSWATATITSRGAVLFNDTQSGKPSVAVFDFGSDKSSSAGTFLITLPLPAYNTAVLRIA